MKKLISLVLTIVLCFGALGITACAEEQSDAVLTEAAVLYSPLTSRIVFNYFPILSGTILKLTYSNGKTETAVVKLTSEGYAANGYQVTLSPFVHYPAIGLMANYGFKTTYFFLENGEISVAANFNAFYVMPLGEFLYMIGKFIDF